MSSIYIVFSFTLRFVLFVCIYRIMVKVMNKVYVYVYIMEGLMRHKKSISVGILYTYVYLRYTYSYFLIFASVYLCNKYWYCTIIEAEYSVSRFAIKLCQSDKCLPSVCQLMLSNYRTYIRTCCKLFCYMNKMWAYLKFVA